MLNCLTFHILWGCILTYAISLLQFPTFCYICIPTSCMFLLLVYSFLDEIQRSQRSMPWKLMWSMVKTPKRVGQSFDLAITAVTIEYMGVTPTWIMFTSKFGHHSLEKNWHVLARLKTPSTNFIPLDLQGAYPRYGIHTSVFSVYITLVCGDFKLDWFGGKFNKSPN